MSQFTLNDLLELDTRMDTEHATAHLDGWTSLRVTYKNGLERRRIESLSENLHVHKALHFARLESGELVVAISTGSDQLCPDTSGIESQCAFESVFVGEPVEHALAPTLRLTEVAIDDAIDVPTRNRVLVVGRQIAKLNELVDADVSDDLVEAKPHPISAEGCSRHSKNPFRSHDVINVRHAPSRVVLALIQHDDSDRTTELVVRWWITVEHREWNDLRSDAQLLILDDDLLEQITTHRNPSGTDIMLLLETLHNVESHEGLARSCGRVEQNRLETVIEKMNGLVYEPNLIIPNFCYHDNPVCQRGGWWFLTGL